MGRASLAQVTQWSRHAPVCLSPPLRMRIGTNPRPYHAYWIRASIIQSIQSQVAISSSRILSCTPPVRIASAVYSCCCCSSPLFV